MNQQEHEKACQEEFGKPYSEVHIFLDQYYPQFSSNHRILLHHRLGIELVVQKFGEEARAPAKQHIHLDWGFVPNSWEDLDSHYFPLTDDEIWAIDQEFIRLYPDLHAEQ